MSTKARKTISVAAVVQKANTFLAADSTTVGDRSGVASLVEAILFETGNYNGFNYLVSEFLPAEEQTMDNVLREGYDPTRRFYYGPKA